MNKDRLMYWILGLLVAIIGWAWSANFTKLCEIEKSLIELKIDMTKVQASMVDREEIKEIVSDELLKHGIK